MSVEKVAFVRRDGKASERAQRQSAREAGISKVYDDMALLLKQRRKAGRDVVAVKRLSLLADRAKRRQRGGLRRSLWDAIDAIEATGSTILELDTNRSTKTRAERDAMIRDALDDLAYSRARSKTIGRPKREWTDAQMAIMRLHWTSNMHVHNEAAVAAMASDGLVVSVSVVTKLLGPSGRLPGTRRDRRSK